MNKNTKTIIMRVAILLSVVLFTIVLLSNTLKINGEENQLISQIQSEINSNEVIVFSKSYCPYCRRAKQTLDALNVKYVAKELDQLPEGMSIQQTLADQITGVRTVPQIFFKGEFFGGSDALVSAFQSGELQKLLKSKGIYFVPEKQEL